MMLNIMTYEDGLKSIHKSYHPTFKRVYDKYIQKDEVILLVAEATHTSQYQEDYGKGKWRRTSHPCILTITNYRWIRAGMNWWGMADSIPYRTIGSRLGSWMGDGDFYKHNWVTPPKRLPNAREMGRKELHERIDEYIREVLLSELENIYTKNYFTCTYQNQDFEVTEIAFESTWVAFKADDGDKAYALLQLAKKNGGIIPLDDNAEGSRVSDNILGKLKELKGLLDEGLITEHDYETKKNEMLSEF